MINPPKGVVEPAKFRPEKGKKIEAKSQCLFRKDLGQKTPLVGQVLLAFNNQLWGQTVL
jgi:hypothetical protein